MAGAEISPKAFFAIRPNVKQNAHYIYDFHVLYTAGSVLVIHNYYENRQKYIKLYEKSLFLELITISFSRKYAAIIQNAEKGQIIVYDLVALKRKKTINLPSDSVTNRFETATFSHDDKFIFAITGEPDWMMVSYKWEMGKVDSITKGNTPNNPAPIIQIICSPTDNSEICLIGPGLFRLLSLNDNIWRQYGFQKADQMNITTGCWLSDNIIICGTSDGKLIVVDNADLKAVLNACTVNVVQIREKDDIGSQISSVSIMKISSEAEREEDRQVRAMISFAKGFAFSCRTGYVHMFEQESPNRYRKRNVFRVKEMDFRECSDFELNTVKHLSVNATHDKLLATTNRAQMYSVRLWGPDLLVAPEIPFRILGEPLHHGPICGLSMCVWKPLFVTCGKFDRTVRLWNYETETVDLVKQFDEDVYSVAFHPTGFFLAVGFTEVLRFMVLLMNDIKPCRDLPIRECPLSLFAWQGNLLAATRNGIIELFQCISFNNTFTLKTPSEKVESMVWSKDDKKLVSCGDDAVVEWDVLTGKKCGEVVTEGVTYKDCAISSDGKFIYVVGSDRLLKEISNSNIIRSVQLGDRSLESIELSRSDTIIFIGNDGGSVLAVRIPMSVPCEYSSYFYHFSSIPHMKLSFNDQTFVTASYGGAVIMWKVIRTGGKAITMDKDFVYSKEILINHNQLQEQIDLLKDLGVKLYDLEMSHASLIRMRENLYAENIKEIHDKYYVLLEELKEKIEQMETDQEGQLVRINEDLNELKLKQEKEMKELMCNYEQKLSLEYKKVEELSSEKEEIALKYERQLSELKESKEAATEEIIKMYDEKLLDIHKKLDESFEEKTRRLEEHSKIKQHLEEDADREIVEMKAHYEKILKEEREKNEFLKVEALNMRKNYGSAQKEMDDYRHKIKTLHVEYKKCSANVQSLEKDIQDLKKEMIERDVSIVDKDKTIYELKKEMQELEKYKTVLDYKIKELRNQIDPKDKEIREKKEQIEDMERELENLQKINISLELQQKELKEKIIATEKELANHEENHRSSSTVLKQIKVDLYNLYQSIDDFKSLKEGIKNVYVKYNQDDTFIRGQSMDTDLQREFMVQREFLEKTISAMKSTLRKSKESKKDDRLKVLENNVMLVEELNLLRKQLKDTLRRVRGMENLLGVKPGKFVTPKEAFRQLQQCLKKQQMIKKEYDDITESAWKELKDLNARIVTLYDRIEALTPE